MGRFLIMNSKGIKNVAKVAAYIFLPTLAIFVALLASVYWSMEPGVLVTVRNVEPNTLRAVTITVAGDTETVGDVGPDEIKSVRVRATGDSHITVEHGDTPERRKRLEADCYLNPGAKGFMTVDVGEDSATVSVDRTRAGL